MNEGRLRGINKRSINVDNFADGVASVYLGNVEKQINGRDLGKNKYSDGSSSSTSNLQFF